jgi:RimJ/RimL family protein N-acetyltransferase
MPSYDLRLPGARPEAFDARLIGAARNTKMNEPHAASRTLVEPLVRHFFGWHEVKTQNGESELITLETERLAIRQMSTDDAEFILHLLNEPSWLRFIGDRGVRSIEDARAYILDGPVEMYARLGFGLYVVELKDSRMPIGLCGLIKRDFLDDIDIGYGFLPQYWAKGYAYESASAVMGYATQTLGLKRIVAITSSDNHRSAGLLEKLGLKYERMVKYPDTDQEVRLFAIEMGDGRGESDAAADS